MSFSSCGGYLVRLRSVCFSRACAVAEITPYSRSPNMIDREQRGLKWLLLMRNAGREPVLRHEIDEFIPQRVDDCVPWNGDKTRVH